jgi:hypothetical protein
MNKLAFTPFSIASGLVAGLIAAKLFERIWSLAMHEDAPDPKYRDTDWRKLVAALAVEGAIARVVRGATDHGTRVAYSRAVGGWPGDETAESKHA